MAQNEKYRFEKNGTKSYKFLCVEYKRLWEDVEKRYKEEKEEKLKITQRETQNAFFEYLNSLPEIKDIFNDISKKGQPYYNALLDLKKCSNEEIIISLDPKLAEAIMKYASGEPIKSEIKKSSEILLDEEIKPLLDQLKKLIDENNFDEAEKIYQQAKEIATSKNDEYSQARLDKQYARIIANRDFDHEREIEILLNCHSVFKRLNATKELFDTKQLLALANARKSDFVTAEIYAKDTLDYHIKSDNLFEIASILIINGFIQMEKHNHKQAIDFFDEAIVYGTRLSLDDDKEKKENGIDLVSVCYHDKSIVFKKMGNLSEAKVFSLKALDGHRQLNKKEETGKILFEMAEMECYEGNFSLSKWLDYIKESKDIFQELHDFSWVARCCDLISKVAYTNGQKALAFEAFEEGEMAIKKTNDKKGIAHFLSKRANFFKNEKDLEKAKKYFNELIAFCQANDLDYKLDDAYHHLAEIADKEGKISLRDGYYTKTIELISKKLLHEQSEIRRVHSLKHIAYILKSQEKYNEALEILERILKIVEEKNEIGGIAEIRLLIGELYEKLGKKEEALKELKKVIEITKGTPYYEFESIAKANLGSYLLHQGNIDEAKPHLEESKKLIDKYKLKDKKLIVNLLFEAEKKQEILTPIEKPFAELIIRLYEGINKAPESLEPLLRHWYFKYLIEISKHWYQSTGIKLSFFSGNLKEVNRFVASLKWLFDFLAVNSTDVFEEIEVDMFVYPYEDFEKGEHIAFIKPTDSRNQSGKKSLQESFEDKLLMALNQPDAEGKFPDYIFCPTILKEREEPTMILVGRGGNLPQIAYDFFETKTADEVINSKTLISNFPRHLAENKLFTDIDFCVSGDGFIPFYPKKVWAELTYEKVKMIGNIETQIPFGDFTDKKAITNYKKLFNSLLQIDHNKAKTALTDIKLEFDSLLDETLPTISIRVSLFEIKLSDKKILYPAVFML